MGSAIEFNDTLQITTEQGFPSALTLHRHQESPIQLPEIEQEYFGFEKPGLRLFHPAPTPVFLVHNIGGKWLYWGRAHILEQTIDTTTQTTRGKFKIIQLYSPEYQRQVTWHQSPEGKSYF